MAKQGFKRAPYAVELRIGEPGHWTEWFLSGVICESKAEAELRGQALAKFWQGKAESRAVPFKRARVESNVARANENAESLFAQLAEF